jgi:multiple antibiotic resistance protein
LDAIVTAALEQTFYAFVTLLALVNPISAAAVFMAVTDGRSPEDRKKIAKHATIIAGVTLVAFAFAGEALLGALGVKIGAFKVAGGLLLLKVAFDMVFAEKPDRRAVDRSKENAGQNDPAVFPLAIPMISGPGALTASVALVDSPDRRLQTGAIFIIAALAVIGITYAFMRGAGKLTRWFGETGIDAVSRVVGIVVAAIAVQLVVNGVSGLTGFTFR